MVVAILAHAVRTQFHGSTSDINLNSVNGNMNKENVPAYSVVCSQFVTREEIRDDQHLNLLLHASARQH